MWETPENFTSLHLQLKQQSDQTSKIKFMWQKRLLTEEERTQDMKDSVTYGSDFSYFFFSICKIWSIKNGGVTNY